MNDASLIETLVDGDWDDDDELEGDLLASRFWKVDQFLTWFSDATGTAPAPLSSYDHLVQEFLADQCESLLRVCNHTALAGYLSHIGTGEAEVLAYLAYLNNPSRYSETEIKQEEERNFSKSVDKQFESR